ncbi:MAG TPA: trypsin-like serine protease [Polyangiaceae bacterium]|nr:trypsin-like serine protease [Polyangiaceae bacterium]
MTKRKGALAGFGRSLALGLALGASGCGSGGSERVEGSQAAVYGGALAPDDTAVVAVINFAGGQCSGSLIAPNLVMTARHCVAKTANEDTKVVCGQTMFEPPDSPGAIFVVSRPEITNDKQDYLAVAEIRMPDGLSDDLCGTDVVLLRMKAPLPDISPLVPRVAEPVAPPETYSSVGFGLDESLPDKPSSVRKRLDGLMAVCVGDACRDSSVRDNEWIGSGGPCQGDSGGPALDASGQIIGVVSRGISGCRQPVFSDVASRSDWLKSEAVLAANAARQAPPSWAPCDGPTPCIDLSPTPDPTPVPDPAPKDDAPAASCSLGRTPNAGWSGWLACGAGFGLLGRRRRTPGVVRHRHGLW